MSLSAHAAAHGDLAEVEGSPSLSSQDEVYSIGQARDQMEKVQQVLKAIFEYYNVSSGSGSHAYQALEEGSLTSMRFQRMALDANLIDEKLTSAKVDLIFHRVCGSSPHMNCSQFLDAVIRLVATKYPSLPRNEGVLRLYNDHLASFSSGGAGSFSDLDEGMLAVTAAARPALQTLYEGYFEAECRQMPQRRGSALQSETQGAFVQMLSDFEVLPELVPKSIAFAVFREVVKVREVPASVRDGLLGSSDAVPPGKKFTYLHFALALMLMARRCFPDEGKTALLRLFEWMDASKGRTHFAAKHPGHLPGGTTNFRIRLLPRSPDAQEVSSLRRRSASVAASSSTSSLVRRRSVPGSLSSSRHLPSDESVAIPESAGPADELSASGSNDRVRTADEISAEKVSSESRRLLQQIFGHYAALGDPLNRTHLSTLKFVRLLRDCGLVPSDTFQVRERASPDFDFAPAQRMQKRSSSASRLSWAGPASDASSRGMGGRSGSTANLRRSSVASSGARGRDGQRDSVTAFSVSSGKRAEGGHEQAALPLRIFPAPLLTQVDADLMFLHATRDQNGATSSGQGGRGRTAVSGSGTAGRRGSRGSVTVKRHHMTADSFLRGLSFVAARCYPRLVAGEALESFCREVLGALTDALGELKGQDVALAASVMAEPEMVRLLEQCEPGLQKIYVQYAVEHAGRRASWNSDAMARFADDFDLLSEISQLPMQKIFRDCMHWETCSGSGGVDGEMSYVGFQLALVTIAQKMHTIAGNSSANPLDQVTSLFCRMNTAASSANFAGSSSRSEPLIPGLPATSSILLRRKSSAGGTVRSEKAVHRESEMSWAQMLAA